MRILLGFILALSLSFTQAEQKHIDVIVSGAFMSNFCKVSGSICPIGKPNNGEYNGMQGQLRLIPVAEQFGKDIYEITMSDGSLLFYSSGKKDFFDKTSGLIKLSTLMVGSSV